MMLNELAAMQNETRTENGAKAFRSTDHSVVDLFFLIGTMRNDSQEDILRYFIRAFAKDSDMALRTAFFARDIHLGLGERNTFRVILQYLARHYPEAVNKNLALIPSYGRFDDLCSLLWTPCEPALAEFLRNRLNADLQALFRGEPVSLLAKWLPSVNASSRKTRKMALRVAELLGMKERTYRKTLSRLRAHIGILETKLCKKETAFDYAAMPSRALYLHRDAFLRRDGKRFQDYLKDVEANKAKLHAKGVFPYEIVHSALSAQSRAEQRTLDTVWRSMPDFTDDRNALAVVDGSGSMFWSPIDGRGTRPAHVAMSLGIYLAERNRGAFHNCFITFSRHPRLVRLQGDDITKKVAQCMTYAECSNTDLLAVFDLILKTAVRNHLPQSDLPETLYILSDMEFDEGVDGDATVFHQAEQLYRSHGYRLPSVVFWNLQSRHGSFPVRHDESGATLVSGFSPTIFRLAVENDANPAKFVSSVLNSERYACISA